MERKRMHVWIEGRVQGVFFRAYTRDAALKLGGLTGWVRNLPDGKVEAVFEGDLEKVRKMVSWCYEGSPLSHVEHVEVKEEYPREEFDRFEVRY